MCLGMEGRDLLRSRNSVSPAGDGALYHPLEGSPGVRTPPCIRRTISYSYPRIFFSSHTYIGELSYKPYNLLSLATL